MLSRLPGRFLSSIPMSKRAVAEELVGFINSSPSPFHAVATAKTMLNAAGFVELSERAPWDVRPNGRYYVTRNHSTLVAFAVGGKWCPGNAFTMIGAHTDSPCLKVKPRSKVENQGYLQVGVEVYGGGLWHTWFDRDLTLAGRVITRAEDGSLRHSLVNLQKPILRIPSLAIHLNREVSSEGFKFNNESNLIPILASSVRGKLEEGNNKQQQPQQRHHPLLIALVSNALGCAPEAIVDFDLCLADTQPAVIGGALDEYIFTPRADNLFNAFTSTKAMIEALPTLEADSSVRTICLFDHEEVGSTSSHGADSLLMFSLIRRLNAAAGSLPDAFEQSLAKSFLISADQAHAVHPNYASKHEDNMRPQMNAGIVIKYNANQRYATTGITSAILRQLASKANVPLQEFAVRNDMACGSTIGPMMSANLGVRTIDIGCAMLSMHSIRETCSADDAFDCVALFRSFFDNFAQIDHSL